MLACFFMLSLSSLMELKLDFNLLFSLVLSLSCSCSWLTSSLRLWRNTHIFRTAHTMHLKKNLWRRDHIHPWGIAEDVCLPPLAVAVCSLCPGAGPTTAAGSNVLPVVVGRCAASPGRPVPSLRGRRGRGQGRTAAASPLSPLSPPSSPLLWPGLRWTQSLGSPGYGPGWRAGSHLKQKNSHCFFCQVFSVWRKQYWYDY